MQEHSGYGALPKKLKIQAVRNLGGAHLGRAYSLWRRREQVGSERLAPGATRQWGSMTVHQMVCHLSDSYLLALGERAAADKSNFLARSVVKLAALHAPMQWPKGVSTVPEMDQVSGGGTPPAQFESDREQLLQIIGRFGALPTDFKFAPHPIFAEMNEWEWMRWGYLHADHHLRQFGL